MAIYPLTDVQLYAKVRDYSCEANQAAVAVSVAELNSTTMCKQWSEIIGGLKTTTVSFAGYSDFAGENLDSFALAQLGLADGSGSSDNVVTVVPNPSSTPAIGDIAYVVPNGMVTSAETLGEVGGLHEVSLSYSGPKAGRGHVLHPMAARTSTASTTATQIGAIADGQKAFVSLHITAGSGTTPTLDVIVESDDNSGMTSPTTQATFTQETATGAESLEIAGPVTDDWWRITYTIGGTTPSFTFFAALGIEP